MIVFPCRHDEEVGRQTSAAATTDESNSDRHVTDVTSTSGNIPSLLSSLSLSLL